MKYILYYETFPEKFDEIFSYESLYDVVDSLNEFWFDYYCNDLNKFKLIKDGKNIDLYSYSEFLNI